MEYPRVTEILKCFTPYKYVAKDKLERACERGTAVHSFCSALAKSDWIPEGIVSESLRGYVNSFKKWSDAQVKEFLIIEKRYIDDIFKFTGKIDFLIKGNDDEQYLIDLKTGSKPQKTHPIQMAAYLQLMNRHNIRVKAAMLIYLNKDGEFPEIHYFDDLRNEFSVFISALECWQYFNNRKKRNGK